jgi:hypothetical protein
MAQVVVLVTFYSRSGATETRASSAAVGAVQGRALIRLRRLPDADAQRVLTDSPGHADSLTRMWREYVAPTEADVRGADAIVIAPTSDCDPSSAQWGAYFELLRSLGAAGALAGKVGAVVRNRDAAAVQRFEDAMKAAGIAVVSPGLPPADSATPEAAIAHGRRVAEAAATRKQE